jgi:hypothetical protein
MNFYRAYHVDAAGKTVGLLNFQAEDDSAACIRADNIQRTENWFVLELCVNMRQVECPNDAAAERGKPWGLRVVT